VIDRVISFASVNADWVERLLKKHGLNVEISALSSAPIGTGQVGATYRFTPDYVHSVENAPETFVGKFPSNDSLSRETGKTHLTYLREAGFYRHFAGKKPMPIPHHLYIAFDEDSHDFTLIMKDLPQHHAGNQLSCPSADETYLAVEAAAKIHAVWWGDPMLDTLPWLNGSKSAVDPLDPEMLYALFWPAFCERFANRVTPEMRRVGEAYLGHITPWIDNRTGPRCLIHGDFRPDNMLFNLKDTAQPIVIVDWQTVGVGHGVGDLSYFMGTALDPATRRACEHDLFDHYRMVLIENGVAKGETQGLWDDYRALGFSGFLMGVTASIVVQQTERGDSMFLKMCERAAAMVIDHAEIALPA
jgi:hypothetical protein